jgi:hypothetical protein
VRRLAIVRLGGPDDGIRRFRLARLDEIALASPPEQATSPPERTGDAAPAQPPAEPDED